MCSRMVQIVWGGLQKTPKKKKKKKPSIELEYLHIGPFGGLRAPAVEHQQLQRRRGVLGYRQPEVLLHNGDRGRYRLHVGERVLLGNKNMQKHAHKRTRRDEEKRTDRVRISQTTTAKLQTSDLKL